MIEAAGWAEIPPRWSPEGELIATYRRAFFDFLTASRASAGARTATRALLR
ncbi:hypothetical protein ACPPVO_35205 [Dactylosporangium sp. McL0621]|uniref:hypothetical protein n=1 Tax=Dactylosporangium sp. McL0621 TaxID=3415678 RepID=UPI003CF9318C